MLNHFLYFAVSFFEKKRNFSFFIYIYCITSTEVNILVLCLKALLETQSRVERWDSEDSRVRPKEKSAVTSVAKLTKPLQTDTAVQKNSVRSRLIHLWNERITPRVKSLSLSVVVCRHKESKHHCRKTEILPGDTRRLVWKENDSN